LTELASEDWVFYTDTEEMNDHYHRVDEKMNRHIRARAKEAETDDVLDDIL